MQVFKDSICCLKFIKVSANGCPTEKISKFVDHFLKPTIKSYVKDTTHFFSLINDIGVLPENVIIATLNVTALYTNIPTRGNYGSR
jgi:hypothetical protein